MIRKAPAGMHC